MAHDHASAGMRYGYHRTEILADLLNGAVFLAIGEYIVYEAWDGFGNHPRSPVAG